MTKVASDLFDIAEGAEPPSDPAFIEKVEGEIDAVSLHLKSLDSEARLKCVRRLANGANASSMAFNVAVFVRDKEPAKDAELFVEPKATAELELF